MNIINNFIIYRHIIYFINNKFILIYINIYINIYYIDYIIIMDLGQYRETNPFIFQKTLEEQKKELFNENTQIKKVFNVLLNNEKVTIDKDPKFKLIERMYEGENSKKRSSHQLHKAGLIGLNLKPSKMSSTFFSRANMDII